MLLYKKGDPHDIGNYRPICLLSVIFKLFTRVILNRIEKILDERQPCEQAGFRKGFSTIDHIHTVSKLIKVSREYKMPLCLTFINLKKAFDSVETEAVVEALDNQGVPTQYIKVFRELYSNITTRIAPLYNNIIIDVKREVRHGDTISPKIFTATLENAMRKLEWDDMGVKVDGWQLHHLRFADDIVLITPSISQAKRMLTEFDETCGCIGLQLNLDKTMFMRNGWVSDAPFTLNGTNISESTSYVYLGREQNMMNDLTFELGRRRRAAWGAYKSIENVVKKTRNTRLRAHLFNTTVLPALTYASETWAFRKQEENARTTGRLPTRWSDFFTKSFKEKYGALRVPREKRNHWATLARDRDKWKNYWRPLDHFEDQREPRDSDIDALLSTFNKVLDLNPRYDAHIADAFDFILQANSQRRVHSVILVGISEKFVQETFPTAQKLMNQGFEIFSISIGSANFSSLSTNASYAFNISTAHEASESITVASNVGNMLFSESSICFHGTAAQTTTTKTVMQTSTFPAVATSTSTYCEHPMINQDIAFVVEFSTSSGDLNASHAASNFITQYFITSSEFDDTYSNYAIVPFPNASTYSSLSGGAQDFGTLRTTDFSATFQMLFRLFANEDVSDIKSGLSYTSDHEFRLLHDENPRTILLFANRGRSVCSGHGNRTQIEERDHSNHSNDEKHVDVPADCDQNYFTTTATRQCMHPVAQLRDERSSVVLLQVDLLLTAICSTPVGRQSRPWDI
ncbi:hypothetical protein RB195_018346 [Necator americanus]|uniref:Reverse transcriptase domain-containing protein n=1 Tax=Necator americanus TaxID=51031 RepID=A0ABR1C9C6_NECAM